MKINSFLLTSMISISFIYCSLSSIESFKSKIQHEKNFPIRPKLSDLTKLVKPFIQEPYQPQEVDNLYEQKQNENPLMTTAEIVGNHERRNGVVEKPTMYNTVITPHETSIVHTDSLNRIPHSFATSAAATAMFNTQANESEKLAQGQIAIPVKLQSQSIVDDPTLANYETPLFLAKKQKEIKKTLPKVPMLSPNIIANSAADAQSIKTKLTEAKSLRQKMRAMEAEKGRLKAEAKGITNKVAGEINNLLDAKIVGQKLEALLKKFTLKIKKDELSKIRLVDRVQIKNELKQKLLREVEGFRNPGTEFTLVDKVDPKDLKKIITQIKKKLGN